MSEAGSFMVDKKGVRRRVEEATKPGDGAREADGTPVPLTPPEASAPPAVKPALKKET